MKYININEQDQIALKQKIAKYKDEIRERIAYTEKNIGILFLATELEKTGRCKQEEFERLITHGDKSNSLVSFLQELSVAEEEEEEEEATHSRRRHLTSNDRQGRSARFHHQPIVATSFWQVKPTARQITVFYNTDLVRLDHRGHLQITNKFTIGVSNTDICPGKDPARLYNGTLGNIYDYEGAGPTTDQNTHLVVMYDRLQMHGFYTLDIPPWQEIALSLPFGLDAKVFQTSDKEQLIEMIQYALATALFQAATQTSTTPQPI